MAINPTEFANVQLTDDFNTWRTRTNKTLAAFSTNTVTTSNTVHSNGTPKAITYGHATLRGTLSANQLYANSYLSGGEFGNPDTLTITTNNYTYGKLTVANNATIGLDGEDELFSKARLRVTANATFRDIVRMDANVFIGTANTDTLVVNAVSTFDGEATFRDDVTVTANVSVTGDSVNITGNTVIGSANTDTLAINATTDINAATNIDGNLTATGKATINGNTVIGNANTDTLIVGADATFNGPVTLNGVTDVSGAISLNGNTTLGDASTDKLTVPSHSVFQSNVTIGDASTDKLLVTGHSQFNSNAYFESRATFNGVTTFTDNITIGNANTDTLTVESGSTFNATSEFKGNLTVQGKSTFNGNTDINGGFTVASGFTLAAEDAKYERLVVTGSTHLGDASSDTVTYRAKVNSHIIPVSSSFNLGESAGGGWNNLYVEGTARIASLILNGTSVTAAAAELNLLDGVTASTSELNLLDGVTATTSELNILDGVTSTASELNTLDGITATTAELNYTDGVTSNIQTQLDAKLNLTGGTMTGNTVTQGLRPSSDNTYDLGSPGHEYRHAYFDGIVYIDTLNLNGTNITSTANELNILDGVTASTSELNLLDGVTASTSELNILDGVTATATELNKLDGVTSTTAELNILDGVTATATELNTLDGITATTTELNYTDGVTSNIQTQLGTKLNLSGGTLTGTLTTRALQPSANTYDIGTAAGSGQYRNVYAHGEFYGTATRAKFADLAEKYVADAVYEVGTVMVVGGEEEITSSTPETAHSVLGVVSDAPAFIMNNGLANGTQVALKGRVPVQISGSVSKGDRLVAGDNGKAIKAADGCGEISFAIALESGTDGTIEAVIL